jgi:hypothetical protein
MLVVFLVMTQVPFLRDFYELTPLSPETVAQLLVTAVAWTAAVHLIRRTGIVGRLEDATGDGIVRAWRRVRPARDEPGQPTAGHAADTTGEQS